MSKNSKSARILLRDERTDAHSYPTESRCIVGPIINRERPCLNDIRNGRGVPMNTFDIAVSSVTGFLERVTQLNARYRSGDMHVYVPEALHDSERTLEELVQQYLPASHAALESASRSLFFSLPVAFDPGESVGPYLAVVDRDQAGQPYRFLDMGALIATQAFRENDPTVFRAILESLPFVGSRYAHSEYAVFRPGRLGLHPWWSLWRCKEDARPCGSRREDSATRPVAAGLLPSPNLSGWKTARRRNGRW